MGPIWSWTDVSVKHRIRLTRASRALGWRLRTGICGYRSLAQSSASASSSADSLELNCKLHRSQIPRAIGVRFTTRRSRFGMALLSDFIVLLDRRTKHVGQNVARQTPHVSAWDSHNSAPQSEH